jgi:ABC-type lipoprotein release transport system permease subunit
MTLGRLIAREILHRKLHFALGVISVLIAVAGLVGALSLLKAHDARTEQLVAEKQKELESQMRDMEEQYRKITLGMGFNILILPKDLDLDNLYGDQQKMKYMPESSADVLARSRLVTIQHLLPILQRRVAWPERKRSVLLVGTRGEAALVGQAAKKPLLERVAKDCVVLGYELHASLGIKRGETIAFMGRTFKVQSCPAERGTKDDVTIWMNLHEAQELLARNGLLEKKDSINCIMALECECAMADLPQVRQEIANLLPDTRVVELAGNALARAEARREARRNAEAAIQREKRARAELRAQKEQLAGILAPLVIAGSAVWVGLLAYGNVRARRTEIGILRALGLRARQILTLFLGKAALIGLAGAVLGIAAGLAIGAIDWPAKTDVRVLVDLRLLTAMLLLTPLLSIMASWIPALLAVRQDPAEVLRRE